MSTDLSQLANSAAQSYAIRIAQQNKTIVWCVFGVDGMALVIAAWCPCGEFLTQQVDHPDRTDDAVGILRGRVLDHWEANHGNDGEFRWERLTDASHADAHRWSMNR